MFLIFLLAQYFGAEYDMVTSMSLAGILMLYDSPLRNSGKWMYYFIYFYFCHWNDCSFCERTGGKTKKK